MARVRILVVEDERKLAQVLGSALQAEHRERIFHRFFRVDGARTRDGARGGVGLGLAIAKWAVEMHGGRIAVDERPSGGSEFRILLPLEGVGAVDLNQKRTDIRIEGSL